MRENSFGVYIIDQNYQIVGYNDTAQKLYPQLKKGNHCYQCLMNLDSPCEECPVLNKTDESRTYFDPMHHSYRAADAVEVNLSETEKGYVLVFSTAREGEKLVKQLTNNEEGLRLLGVINVLGNDYSDIYSVDVKSGKMQSFRYSGKALGIKEALCQETSYEQAMEEYIDTNVISEDQGKLRFAQSLSKLCDQLKVLPQVTVHYRARVNGEIHYYYMKCARVGKEEIENLVIAFSNEDTDVKRNELESTIIPGSVSAKRKILVVEDNELNREILTELLSEKFDILTAENGEIGLKMLSEHYRELSAVLLDVYMPVCDGFEFLERIKDDVMLSSVPVIVTTGSNRPEDEEHCLELGAVDFISKPYKPKVVKARLNSVIKLRESAAALSAIEYDELTGLYTRQAFYHHAKTLINFRSDKKFHVLVADIHNFKLVNSIYGEKMGDQVLEYLAKVFSGHIGDGLLARYGSDQFICLVCGDVDLSLDLVEQRVRKITEEAPIPNLVIKYGMYQNADISQPLTIICDRAFTAMKSIQYSYERNVATYDGAMSQKHIREMMMENEFESAIEKEEFVIWYQPKYDVKTERIEGAEALVRWKKSDGTMIPPGEFIPLFERNGLIVRLDEYVFRKVCQIQRERMERGERVLPVSVNLSRATLHHEGIVERYAQIIYDSQVPFETVPIELTETAALYSIQIQGLTEKMVDVGFLLHMDDFGSGYSSMTSLNVLPFRVLKLDKALIDFIGNSRGDQVIQHTIALAHGLGMKVLAEGVEVKEQVEFLRTMECDEIQGFYYARPLPLEVFSQLLDEEQKA